MAVITLSTASTVLDQQIIQHSNGTRQIYQTIRILSGFLHEMDFTHLPSQNPTRVACDEDGIWRPVVRNPSHMKNHTKCIFSHTLHFKAR